MYQLCKSCFHVKIDPRRGVSAGVCEVTNRLNYQQLLAMFTALPWRFFVPFSLVNSNCWFAGKTRNASERCYGDMPLWQGWRELRMIFMHLYIHDVMHMGSSQLVPYGVETCWHRLFCSFANGFSALFRSGLFFRLPCPPAGLPWTSLWTPDKTGNTYFAIFEDMVVSLDSELTK